MRAAVNAGSTGTGDSTLQMKVARPASQQAQEVRSAFHTGTSQIQIAEGGLGDAPMPLPYRAEMETAFGQSFGSVQAHAGSAAKSATEELGARAYALGDHIAFESSSPPKAIVAHELAHTVQQAGSGSSPQAMRPAGAHDACEADADRAATAVLSGHRAEVQECAPAAVQRWPKWLDNLFSCEPEDRTDAELEIIMTSDQRQHRTPSVNDLEGAATNLGRELPPMIQEFDAIPRFLLEFQQLADQSMVATAARNEMNDLPGIAQRGRVRNFMAAFLSGIPPILRGNADNKQELLVNKCLELANGALVAAGVPGLQGVSFEQRSDTAVFMPGPWALVYDTDKVLTPLLGGQQIQGQDPLEQLARKTLHESRHCEQKFLVFRLRAARYKKQCEDYGDTWDRTEALTYVNGFATNISAVVEAAVDGPVLALDSDEATRATAVGAGFGRQAGTIGEVENARGLLTGAVERARNAHATVTGNDFLPDRPSKANRRAAKVVAGDGYRAKAALPVAKERLRRKFTAYLNMPHEVEARAVEELVKLEYQRQRG